MKRILCIINSLNAGGAETFLMKVYHTLPPVDYQFDFIVSEGGGCYTQKVLERGGQIYKIPMRTKDPVGALNGIRKIVKENGYECVLKLGDRAISALDLLMARLGGAKCLAMRSCNAPTKLSTKNQIIHLLFRPLLNVVANVKLAPSMLAAEFTFGKQVAHKEVHIMNNGVDLNVFYFDAEGRARIQKEFNLEDKLVIGHIGRFHEQKNHLFLLEIFNEIRKRRKDAVLLLVGIGNLEGVIRDRVREMKVEDSVIFAGQRFDIPQILSAMDVFVFPSLHEGMPNTVIEAQSTGLPCVIADTITPDADITGLVHYRSLSEKTENWAETALSIIENQRKNTSYDFIQQGYDIQSVAQKFVELLFR